MEGWGDLPHDLLDAIKESFDLNIVHELSCLRVVDRPLERRARLVNRHWSKWATEATKSLILWSMRSCQVRVSVETRLLMISTKFKNLTQLNLTSGLGVSNRILCRLITLSSLQDLRLGHAIEITDEGLRYLKYSTSLKRLSLNSCRQINGWSLARWVVSYL